MVTLRKAVVFGGSGFLGNYVVKRLVETGYAVEVISRNPERAKHLKTCGSVGQVALTYGDITKPKTYEKSLHGAEVVVNLVGLLYQSGKQRFAAIHTKAAENLAKLAHERGTKHFIHVSALSVDKHTRSLYARTKLKGEEAVRDAFPEAVILRPGVIFAPEDRFYNLFAQLITLSPGVLPMIGIGRTRFQPVYAADVAEAVIRAITMPAARGKIFELGGPRTYSLRRVMRYISHTIGRKVFLLPMPLGVVGALAFFLELLPHPLLTRDQVRLFKADNVVGDEYPGLKELNINPTPAEAIVPEYLVRFNRNHYLRHLISS